MKWTPEKRAERITFWRAICEEIDRGGRPYHSTCVALGDRIKTPGFSAKNIRTFFDRWVAAGRRDSALDPYAGLFEDKKRILTKHNLTPETIRLWFKAKGISISQWATANGFQTNTAGLAISGKRVGLKSQMIMDRLASDILGAPTHLLEEAASIETRLEKLTGELANIKRRIKAAAPAAGQPKALVVDT